MTLPVHRLPLAERIPTVSPLSPRRWCGFTVHVDPNLPQQVVDLIDPRTGVRVSRVEIKMEPAA